MKIKTYQCAKLGRKNYVHTELIPLCRVRDRERKMRTCNTTTPQPPPPPSTCVSLSVSSEVEAGWQRLERGKRAEYVRCYSIHYNTVFSPFYVL